MDTKEDIKVICIIGKSSAGKDTFYKKIKDVFDYNFIVSHTSRDMRPNEKNGVDYFFTSKDEFEEMIAKDLFLEVNNFNGWYYGISKNSFTKDKINVVVINPAGYKKIKELFGDKNVIGIYMQTHTSIRINRYIKRDGCFKFELVRRLFTDYIDFKNVDKLSNTYIIKGTSPFKINLAILKDIINKWIG